MGADIYDWDRVGGEGSYQKLIDGGCSKGRHQEGCSHGEPPYVWPATAALDAAWAATAGMRIQSGEAWERLQRAEFIIAVVQAAWPVVVAAERERITQLAAESGATCIAQGGIEIPFADLIGEPQP